MTVSLRNSVASPADFLAELPAPLRMRLEQAKSKEEAAAILAEGAEAIDRMVEARPERAEEYAGLRSQIDELQQRVGSGMPAARYQEGLPGNVPPRVRLDSPAPEDVPQEPAFNPFGNYREGLPENAPVPVNLEGAQAAPESVPPQDQLEMVQTPPDEQAAMAERFMPTPQGVATQTPEAPFNLAGRLVAGRIETAINLPADVVQSVVQDARNMGRIVARNLFRNKETFTRLQRVRGPQNAKQMADIIAQISQDMKDAEPVEPLYQVRLNPPASNLGEKVTDVAGGVIDMVAEMAIIGKVVPSAGLSPYWKNILTWETQSRMHGGTPGMGAVMGTVFHGLGTVGSLGKTVEAKVLAKVASTALQGGAMFGQVKLEGGTDEDGMIAGLVPVAFAALGAKQTVKELQAAPRSEAPRIIKDAMKRVGTAVIDELHGKKSGMAGALQGQRGMAAIPPGQGGEPAPEPEVYAPAQPTVRPETGETVTGEGRVGPVPEARTPIRREVTIQNASDLVKYAAGYERGRIVGGMEVAGQKRAEMGSIEAAAQKTVDAAEAAAMKAITAQKKDTIRALTEGFKAGGKQAQDAATELMRYAEEKLPPEDFVRARTALDNILPGEVGKAFVAIERIAQKVDLQHAVGELKSVEASAKLDKYHPDDVDKIQTKLDEMAIVEPSAEKIVEARQTLDAYESGREPNIPPNRLKHARDVLKAASSPLARKQDADSVRKQAAELQADIEAAERRREMWESAHDRKKEALVQRTVEAAITNRPALAGQVTTNPLTGEKSLASKPEGTPAPHTSGNIVKRPLGEGESWDQALAGVMGRDVATEARHELIAHSNKGGLAVMGALQDFNRGLSRAGITPKDLTAAKSDGKNFTGPSGTVYPDVTTANLIDMAGHATDEGTLTEITRNTQEGFARRRLPSKTAKAFGQEATHDTPVKIPPKDIAAMVAELKNRRVGQASGYDLFRIMQAAWENNVAEPFRAEQIDTEFSTDIPSAAKRADSKSGYWHRERHGDAGIPDIGGKGKVGQTPISLRRTSSNDPIVWGDGISSYANMLRDSYAYFRYNAAVEQNAVLDDPRVQGAITEAFGAERARKINDTVVKGQREFAGTAVKKSDWVKRSVDWMTRRAIEGALPLSPRAILLSGQSWVMQAPLYAESLSAGQIAKIIAQAEATPLSRGRFRRFHETLMRSPSLHERYLESGHGLSSSGVSVDQTDVQYLTEKPAGGGLRVARLLPAVDQTFAAMANDIFIADARAKGLKGDVAADYVARKMEDVMFETQSSTDSLGKPSATLAENQGHLTGPLWALKNERTKNIGATVTSGREYFRDPSPKNRSLFLKRLGLLVGSSILYTAVGKGIRRVTAPDSEDRDGWMGFFYDFVEDVAIVGEAGATGIRSLVDFAKGKKVKLRFGDKSLMSGWIKAQEQMGEAVLNKLTSKPPKVGESETEKRNRLEAEDRETNRLFYALTNWVQSQGVPLGLVGQVIRGNLQGKMREAGDYYENAYSGIINNDPRGVADSIVGLYERGRIPVVGVDAKGNPEFDLSQLQSSMMTRLRGAGDEVFAKNAHKLNISIGSKTAKRLYDAWVKQGKPVQK